MKAAALALAVLLLAYIAFFALGLPDGISGVTWPSIRDALGLPQAGLGLLVAGAGGGYLAAGLATGLLIERWGIGKVLARAMGLLALGLLVEALAPGWPLLVVGAAAGGFGSGAVDAGLNAFAALHFSPRRVNWLHGCYSLGTTAAPLSAVAVLAGGSSWRLVYAVLAAVLLALTGAFAATRDRWEGSAVPAGRGRRAWRIAARRWAVRLQAGLFFCYTGVEITLGQWGYTVLHEGRGVSAVRAGLLISLYWGGIAAGRFALGALVEWVGADRLVRLCTLGALSGTALFAAGPAWASLPGLLLAGLALAPIFPTLIALGPGRVGAAVAVHAVGFQVAAGMLGSSVWPALAGVAASWLGLASPGWIALLAAAFLLALHERLLARAPNAVGPTHK